LEFLEQEQGLEAEPEEIGAQPRPRPPERQQILLRRGMAVGGGIVLLILLVIGFRGCLDARKERAFKDYTRDVAALTEESDQIGEAFFGLLENPRSLTPLDYEAEIKSDRGAAAGLVSRAENLDAPGEMNNAHDALVLTLELRRDGLQTVADNVGVALAREGSEEATQAIADQMQVFLSSDVIYDSRAKTEIDRVLRREGIAGVEAPESQFLPSLTWVDADKSQVTEALGRVSGGGVASTPGVHGLGLIAAVAQPGAITLDENARASLGSSSELEVQVQNQGESEETDVVVTVTIGGETPLERTIPRIAPGEIASVNIPLSPAPPSGNSTLEVNVEPVAGEQVEDNNSATYQVSFG
jgi:CARDB protein